MNKSSHKQGFTIIETLVAIAVLMIAIAGPLSIANKGLTGALASRDQMIASYLAQESFEVVKNLRDTNLDATVNWLDGGGYALSSCTYNNPCDASAIDLTKVAAGKANPLRLTTGNYYSHAGAGSLSLFTRYFYLSLPNSPATPCPNSGTECTVTVAVEWIEGIMPYNIKIANELANTYR